MKKKSMLAALVMLSLLQGSVYAEDPYYDQENNAYYGKGNNGNPILLEGNINYDKVYGDGGENISKEEMNGVTVIVNSDDNGNPSIKELYGVIGNSVTTSHNTLEINGGIFEYNVNGVYNTNTNTDAKAEYNNITINGANKIGAINGIQLLGNGTIYKNTITVDGLSKDNEVGMLLGFISEGQNSIIDDNDILICDGKIAGVSVARGNIVTNNNLEINENAEITDIYGINGLTEISNNEIIIAGNSVIKSNIFITNSLENTKVHNNDLILKGQAILESASLNGYTDGNTNHQDNSLIIDGWKGKKIGAVNNFDDIEFKNFEWDTTKTGENALVVISQDSDLSETDININRDNDGNNGIKLNGGQTINSGDSMTLIYNANGLGDIAALEGGKEITTNLSVATALDAVIEQSEDKNSINLTAKEIKLNDQTMLVAENRAVAAAFVNQGTDLIADSLDTLSRDGKYGVKTFAAVHGNRSKYDVNSDIKINGWSTIVGVGSETEHNGGDFSWGVFYENGSGNYRTFNSFNNEFFRGDGSLVYNGGGIAARYENAHGVYTEGSLRAGILKSDMDNALSDGENKYGYSSESEYYGAHIGIGQIIPLTESSDLDVYGKFFHTYTEGDSFKVDTDEFEFDSINSDRLRIGARLTTNKENKFSTYYGLAYEYEFNGDAEMRAAGMSAPTQSLQGSSYMAEVGFNYQPTPESPWSFDLNMRGYAGEREGATFNVQATYTF